MIALNLTYQSGCENFGYFSKLDIQCNKLNCRSLSGDDESFSLDHKTVPLDIDHTH